ncbi:MAG TPA: ATP-binding protein [Chitinispirillaceae bacterium]|jgi:signal transduction histidine kinase|nr:ATP-binding protein [Chitinispirillaceae bacterium]
MTVQRNEHLLTLLYLGSAITTIIFASIALTDQISKVALILNVFAIVVMVLTTIPFFTKYDFLKLIKLRTYSDHIIIASAVVLQTTPPSFIYFYIFIIWIQSLINTYVLDIDRKLSIFLKITPLLVCIYSFTFLRENILIFYLFSFSIVLSLSVLYAFEKSLEKHKRLENAAQAVKDVHHRILIHNIRSQSNQLLLKLSKDYPEIESIVSGTIEQIIASVGGITEENKVKSDIFLLVNRMAAYFSVNYSMRFNLHLRNTPAMLYEQLFLSALYIFFSNSQEAGASRIKIYRDGNSLIIEDNGCGFDTSKIGLGFSTKKNGRGIGLVSALEACRKSGIDVRIESQPDDGTRVFLNIANVLLTA